MSGLLIGYARVSTEEQDLTAQRDGLAALGVDVERIYVDHGLTGTNRERPGLREALAACRAGDTLVVTKLDRLARSLPDARAIAEDLTKRKVRLSLGASVYDPTDPVGRLLFNVLAMVAEFEGDLIRSRTRERMRVAKAKGNLRGKQPKLNPRQEAHLVELLNTGEYTTGEVGHLFGVGRSTVYRAVVRSKQATAGAAANTNRKPQTASRDSACYICANPRAVSASARRAERASLGKTASAAARLDGARNRYRQRNAEQAHAQAAQAVSNLNGLHRRRVGLRARSHFASSRAAPRRWQSSAL